MTRQKRILIVDDSDAMRRMLATILRSLDYFCLQASNGIEAIHALSQQQVDLVITDLEMPIANGLELIDHMVRDERLRGIPVLVCTAREDDPALVEQLSSVGVHGILTKPVSAAQLLAMTSSLVKS